MMIYFKYMFDVHIIMITESDWNSVRYLTPKVGGYGFIGYPSKMGAYVIFEHKFFPRYVGMGNIHDRMDVHLSQKLEENSRLKQLMVKPDNSVVVAYAICSETEAKNIERTLYNRYGGKDKLYNERDPTGEIIEVESPNFLKWV